MKYLDYPQLYKDTQVIVDCTYIDGKFAIRLEQTIFYVKGGGQPCDVGVVSLGDKAWKVVLVANIEGEIYHFLDNYVDGLSIGDNLNLAIDVNARVLNSKLHTTGHLIDEAMITLGFFDKLTPTKGYHYPPVSSVEYMGDMSDINLYDLAYKVEHQVNLMILNGFKTKSFFINQNEILKFCHDQTADVNTLFKNNKALRVVIVWGDKGMMCGGTHIEDISQIGAIEIPKITFKKNILKISYSLK